MSRQGRCARCPKPTSTKSATLCRTCFLAEQDAKAAATAERTFPAKICGHPVENKRGKYCLECYKNRGRQANRGDKADTGGAVVPLAGEDPARDQALQRLKDEAGRYRKAYEQTVKTRADEERLIDLFQSAIARFPRLPAAAFKAIEPVRPSISKASDEVPVLLLGDQQIGEVVRAEEVHGINRYDFGVYQARLEHLEGRVIDILCEHQKAPFQELVILSMGDNVSGVIHDELQKYGHQHIVDQVYLGALTTALFFYRLLARLRRRGIRRVRVSCVSGNHGRLSHLKESKQYYKNFDYLFNAIVANALRDEPAIDIFIPKCLFTVVEVAGQRVLQSHGHELPPSSLGIPLYSINRASAGYQELLSATEARRFDYWVMGHFHRPLELDNAMVNGTMAGMTEFGIGRFKPIRPMQRLMGFHRKWGKTWEYPIRLDLAPPDATVYRFDPDMPSGDALGLFTDSLKAAKAS